jgi:hypothetical protein
MLANDYAVGTVMLLDHEVDMSRTAQATSPRARASAIPTCRDIDGAVHPSAEKPTAVMSPFMSPGPDFWLCRAEAPRNHNPRVGGSSPSSGIPARWPNPRRRAKPARNRLRAGGPQRTPTNALAGGSCVPRVPPGASFGGPRLGALWPTAGRPRGPACTLRTSCAAPRSLTTTRVVVASRPGAAAGATRCRARPSGKSR